MNYVTRQKFEEKGGRRTVEKIIRRGTERRFSETLEIKHNPMCGGENTKGYGMKGEKGETVGGGNRARGNCRKDSVDRRRRGGDEDDW